ncbi:MAG: Xaa-Pro peptidase family protein [Oscillospiraceae bacterium]|nr:Xaa-Pro peptidase family protein [Oscillospiraceae bacterium]
MTQTTQKVPKTELDARMAKFRAAMDKAYPDWELCVLAGDINQYYLTGALVEGALFIPRGGQAELWARRGYDRAVLESEFPNIRRMSGFREAAAAFGSLPAAVYLDMGQATMEWYGLLSRHMGFQNVFPVDAVCLQVRAVKSDYELAIMRRAGGTIDRLFTESVPALLREGISEAELGAEFFALCVKNGYHGLSRFMMRADTVLGSFCFGESALYPAVFNGASGIKGLCPAAPVLGSGDAKLKRGELVYIDLAFGMEGYNTDKTVIFSLGAQPEYVKEAHAHCLELERAAAAMLRPGVRPSDIYKAVLEKVRPELREGFMGAPGRTVPFLGHGIGLYVDEYPVLAKGFDAPLECGMTLAVEPKVGIPGVGMVGSENVYLVTGDGGVSLTGAQREICEL